MHPDALIAVAGLFVALGGFVQSGIGLGSAWSPRRW